MAQSNWQRVWAAVNGTLALVLAGTDWLARDNDWGSFMAPSHALLWLSIALGSGLGLVGLVATWLMSRSQRKFYVEFARLPVRERLLWRHQRWNLLYSGWFLVLMFGLVGWCWFSGVFVMPAIFAANAVLFAALPAWVISPAAPEPQRQA